MGDAIESLDLPAWVERAPNGNRHFREAVHTILHAISTSMELSTKMIMKGGMLMAIRYDSSRFTRDIDFSTRAPYAIGNETILLNKLDEQLILANGRFTYDVMCMRQRSIIRPKKPGANFPTLNLSIGYARQSNPRELSKLLAKQAPTVVEIDYSYNEAVLDTEVLRLANGSSLEVYSQVNLMAEKYRSILQQSIRNRYRRQDAYDLFLLLKFHHTLGDHERSHLLKCLVESARTREINPKAHSLRDSEIRTMTSNDYGTLESDIEGELPPFDEVYQTVQDFYESLPW
ncbi:nucleotidyl transferase AbiEii/AbiGii toxin family protein [Verminephrobacter aporrectodeae subsp. tuberculatae]|uniref:nucleotidyl transferase AbiEii/AbiGii toxin family protein n=1 Tax=Verminephrobacter aporrectodeae TaxID=1110389 RepID=UPI002238D28C|nr:nucleotidyl transferase AbiEii/AbiGii toxin family protein [Verminephrobacter aporrectodeae]MCW5257976.1 nucleotidyl transferase AbiEii/AbiGii toxin family protein [Verminephrobacter aporrectodeae subsp. tuberculatae]